MDSNQNGVLDATEIQSLVNRQLGRKPNKQEVDQFMKQVDKDDNGNMSLQEYLNFLAGPGWQVENGVANVSNICGKTTAAIEVCFDGTPLHYCIFPFMMPYHSFCIACLQPCIH